MFTAFSTHICLQLLLLVVYHCIVFYLIVSRGFAVFADAWLSDWLAEISADLREAVAH